MSKRRIYPPDDESVDYLLDGLSICTIAGEILATVERECRQGIPTKLVNVGLSQTRDAWRREMDRKDLGRLDEFMRRELGTQSWSRSLTWK